MKKLNKVVVSKAPDSLRNRETVFTGPQTTSRTGDYNPEEGLNLTVFGSSTDLMGVIKAKGGVNIKNSRTEILSSAYLPPNPQSMSLQQYQGYADQHSNLASIAQRGTSEKKLMTFAETSIGIESGVEITLDSYDRRIHEGPSVG